jgi:hypothetical protein
MNRAIIGSALSLVFKVETSENTDLTYHLILVSFFMYDYFSQTLVLDHKFTNYIDVLR